MIVFIIGAVYLLGLVCCARWLYRKALAGGYQVTETAHLALAVGWALAISLLWPVVLVAAATYWFITAPTDRRGLS